MIEKKRIHAGYEDRRYTLWRFCEYDPQRFRVGNFYSIHLNKAMDDHVIDGTYGWEVWEVLQPALSTPVWRRDRGKITGALPFESYDHMHLSLKDLSTSVVLLHRAGGLRFTLHKVHKPPHRRRLVDGETLCKLAFDEQSVRGASDDEKAADYFHRCAACYGPDRDKEREREKWLS